MDRATRSQIIGAQATIHSDGVVKLQVPRAEQIRLGGVDINPYLNTFAPVAFEPAQGTVMAVADYNMIASEVVKVVATMRWMNWVTGCLYNQETDEHPQLYFTHQSKCGDPYELAFEIRQGFGQMNVVLAS